MDAERQKHFDQAELIPTGVLSAELLSRTTDGVVAYIVPGNEHYTLNACIDGDWIDDMDGIVAACTEIAYKIRRRHDNAQEYKEEHQDDSENQQDSAS